MPSFAAQTPPDYSKVRATRLRALLAGRIARDGEIVTVTRRNDTQGQPDYTQSIPALVRQIKETSDDIKLEGIENLGEADPTMFTFEGGWDINEATDRITWGGARRRIVRPRRHPVQGQIVGIYALTVRE